SGGRAFPCVACDIGRLAQWRFATALTRLPLRGQRRNGQKASPASRFNPSADAAGSPGWTPIVRHAGRRVGQGEVKTSQDPATIFGVDKSRARDMLWSSVPAVATRRMKREAGEATPMRSGQSGVAPQR